MGNIIGVCISKEKGTAKKNIGSCEFIKDFGLKDDAHAGKWHRQVSLLSYEKFTEFKERGADIEIGAFGENLLVSGFDFKVFPVGTIFECGDVVLEITQIGKKCHSECEIFHQVGDCIMPREGVFAKVLRGGTISVDDTLKLVTAKKFRAGIIVASDKGSRGEREDKSGPIINELIAEFGYDTVEQIILPDEEELLYEAMIKMADIEKYDAIFTTGGTGLSKRDVTPEATMKAATKNVPGIAEGIRNYSLSITPKAMYSRAVSVMRNDTLIINLPGSPKACKESLEYLLPTLSHAILIMRGETSECARK